MAHTLRITKVGDGKSVDVDFATNAAVEKAMIRVAADAAVLAKSSFVQRWIEVRRLDEEGNVVTAAAVRFDDNDNAARAFDQIKSELNGAAESKKL